MFVLALLSPAPGVCAAPGVLLARSALHLVRLLVLGPVQHLHLLCMPVLHLMFVLALLSPAPGVLLPAQPCTWCACWGSGLSSTCTSCTRWPRSALQLLCC
jgi:hypothetical protein